LSGLLAALVVAGVPGASPAGWGSAFTAAYHSAYPPDGASAEARAREAGEASGDSVFRLACHSCGRCGYGTYYPAYRSYYPSYGYYPGVSYYSGCNGCYPCGCNPTCGYYSGW
jgi:hypothetical protein